MQSKELNDNNYKVYMHISPNGKRYVGITCQPVCQRWRNGNGYARNEHFYRAISKYGWDSFKHIILFEGLNEDAACEIEKELVEKFHLTNPKRGYNLHTGGLHHTISESTRKKISESRKGLGAGEKNPFYGKHHTEETLEKIRKPMECYDLEGNYITTYKSLIDAAIDVSGDCSVIAKSCKKKNTKCYGFQWKYKGSNKIITQYKRTAHNKRIVNQYTLDGVFIRQYESLQDAGKEYGGKASDKTIGQCCLGRQKKAYGFLWKYAD